jgi:Trk K+ transport system NAD-binding subunit
VLTDPSLTPPAPVVLAGDGGVAVRTREELEGLGEVVVCICGVPASRAAQAAEAAGARLIVGELNAPETWHAAGVQSAQAVGILGEDDLHNLDGALLVAELAPELPVVVSLARSELADGVQHLLGPHATVLAATELAAPAFVRAALSGNAGQRVTVSGRQLEVVQTTPDDPGLVVVLCNADTPTDVLPTAGEVGPSVLALVDPGARAAGVRGALPQSITRQMAARERPRDERRPRRRARERLQTALGVVPRRAWILALVLSSVYATSTLVFMIARDLGLVDAMYFTSTTMATVGYGDINLGGSPHWLKIYGVGLMALTALLSAAFFAFLTDMLVSTRIDRALGRFPRPRRDHVIVCGLGKAGSSIVTLLHAQGIPCIGVEQHAAASGVATARALQIPVVLGDVRLPGTLAELRADTARALMAVTDDDLANLQCGLTAREHNPALRVVLRCFDPHLAERLDRTIELDLTRSVAGLAAPALAAALLGRPLAEPLALSNVPLRVLEVTVRSSSRWAGSTVAALEATGLRVVTCAGRWHVRPDYPIEAGDAVAVVGTRLACDGLLRDS